MKKFLFVLFLFSFYHIFALIIRNPFSFAELDDNQIKFKNLAKLNLDSNVFIVNKAKNKFNIIKPGEYIFGYKVIDILDDYIIIQDAFYNEAVVVLD